MSKPLISIVLGSIRPSQLAQCLASIGRYTRDIDYEVVVISPFDFEPPPNVVHVKEVEPKGYYKAIASAFEVAKGEYILHIADDCRATPFWAANMIAFMRPHDDEIFEGSFRHFDVRGEEAEQGHYGKLIAPFICIRKDKAEQIGGLMDCYYESFYGDPDLSFRVWHSGGRVETCPDAWIYHPDCKDELYDCRYSTYFNRDLQAFIRRWYPIFARQEDSPLGHQQPLRGHPISAELPPEECTRINFSLHRNDWKTVKAILNSENSDACIYGEGFSTLYNHVAIMLRLPLYPKKTLYSILEWLSKKGYTPSHSGVQFEKNRRMHQWIWSDVIDDVVCVITESETWKLILKIVPSFVKRRLWNRAQRNASNADKRNQWNVNVSKSDELITNRNASQQIISKTGVIFQCPKCKKGGFDKGKDYWHCKFCGQKYEVRHEVPILDVRDNLVSSVTKVKKCDIENRPIYSVSPNSGSVGGDNPDKFLNEVEQKGWRTALENLWGLNSAGLLRAIAPNRIAWKYLLEIDSSWKVLDIGAGTGGVSCRLAKECSVVALDKSWGNAAFVHLRAQQDRLSRFETVVGDGVSLPFEPNQFDLTTMIGSLEWIPTSWPENKPREMQLQALREVYRVLKPGGNFFLGIENRLYLGYFLGILEPHTNLKYISLMNRVQAEILSQDLRGCPYLELIHSKDEYIELLKEAGFEDIQAFWLHPDYSTPNYIIPLDMPNIIKFFIEERLNPWDFHGVRSPLYRFYRLLDPLEVSNHVEFYGFLAHRPNQENQ